MTYEELVAKYEDLSTEQAFIPGKMDDVLANLEPMKNQVSNLEKQARDMDLEISEKPAQVYEKRCTSAFLWFGHKCQEYPMPNPHVASQIIDRNNLTRQRNTLMDTINTRFDEISVLTDRQVEIEKEQVALRESMLSTREALTREPSGILETLSQAIKALFSREQYQEATEVAEEVGWKERLVPLLPYIAVGGGILVLVLRRRKGGESERK